MLRLNQSKLNSEFCWVDSKNLVSAPEFLRQVSSARQILQAKGERLALCFNDSYAFAVSLLAGLSLNKKLIILPNNKTATLELFRNEYDQIICDEDFLKWIPAARPEDLEIDLHAKIVFFTSGSSGVSKKIEKRFENIYAELKNLDETFSPRLLGSTVIATVSHQHIYGFLFKVLWPILFKRTWVNTPIEYPEMILNYSAKLESFCLISTPAFLKRCLLPVTNVADCRAIFSSGGFLDFTSAQEMNQIFSLPVTEVYGSTESGGVAYRDRSQEFQLWKPFSQVRVNADMDGQLSVQSPYFDQAHLLMDDQVLIKEDGFELLGRTDDVVKIEEKRISLSEINQKILQTKWVQDSVVIALDHQGRQQTACIAVLSDAGRQSDSVIQDLRQHLMTYFEASVVPRKFRFLEKLPYNSQSKLIHAELKRCFHD